MDLSVEATHDPEIDFGIIKKAARLGVFDFRAFLNLAMLMMESELTGLPRNLIFTIIYYFPKRENANK